MNVRNVIPGLIAAAALAALIVSAVIYNRRMRAELPRQVERIECANQAVAYAQAASEVRATGGVLGSVLATGSMVPFLPACPQGRDPLQTVVAYSLTDPRLTYADVRVGTLCVYRYAPNHSLVIIHQAAQRDRDGWIMSGLANSRSESWSRMTADNFVGVVSKVYLWPQ